MPDMDAEITVQPPARTYAGRLLGIFAYSDHISIDLDQGKGQVRLYIAIEDVVQLLVRRPARRR